MRCTFLGCATPATKTIRPDYGNPWYGCNDHAPAMSAALGGTTTPIEATATTGSAWDTRSEDTWIDKL